MASVAELFISLKGKDQTSGVLKGLATVGGAALGGLATASIQTGLAFDKAYDSIQIGTGATGDALKGLQGDMKSVFANVPVDMGQASDAITQFNTLTGDTGEELVALATNALNAGRILGEDTAQLVGVAGRALNVFNLEGEAGAAALDAMFLASQATNIPMTQLATSLQTFGPILKNINMELPEATAFMSSLYKAGVDVSRIMPAINMASRKWAQEGITDLKGELYDTIGRIKEATTTTEALTIATDTFGAEGAQRMTNAIRDGTLELEDFVLQLEDADGAIGENAAAVDDWKEKWVLLRNKAQLALEPLGKIAPIVGPMSPMIAKMGPAFIAAGTAMGGLAARQIPALLPGLRSLSLAMMGPVGIAVAAGAAAVALGIFIAKNQDMIDSLPVIGGLISGTARYQRELNEALEEANDLYERNLISQEELKERGIQALGASLVTLTEEMGEHKESVGLWASVNEASWESYLGVVADTVKDMQKEGAELEDIYAHLERAGIDWKDTIIDDVLRPMRIQTAAETSKVVGFLGNMATKWKEAATNIELTQGELAEETEEDYGRITDAIKGVLPAVNQTFEEWSKQLTEMFSAQVAFDANLRTLYEELASANVENVSDIVRTVEEGGPMAAQAAVNMLHEGTMGIEAYRLLGEHITVTKGYTGDIIGVIEEEKVTMVLEMFEFARAMVGGFASKLIEETPKAVTSVNYMTGEIKQALTGSPQYKTWHWGIEMAEDLALGLITGLNQQGPYAAGFIGQWAATFSEIYAQGGELAAKMYFAQLNSMLQSEYPGVADELAAMFDNLLYINEDRGGEAGEAGGSKILMSLGGAVQQGQRALGTDVSGSLRMAMASFSGEAGLWGEGIAGYIMAGIYRGFADNFESYAQGIAAIIYDELKDALGASSPAKKMIPLGVAAAEGYSLGFERTLALPYAPVSSAGGTPAAPLRPVENHYHFDGPFLGDRYAAEQFAQWLEPYLVRRGEVR